MCSETKNRTIEPEPAPVEAAQNIKNRFEAFLKDALDPEDTGSRRRLGMLAICGGAVTVDELVNDYEAEYPVRQILGVWEPYLDKDSPHLLVKTDDVQHLSDIMYRADYERRMDEYEIEWKIRDENTLVIMNCSKMLRDIRRDK